MPVSKFEHHDYLLNDISDLPHSRLDGNYDVAVNAVPFQEYWPWLPLGWRATGPKSLTCGHRPSLREHPCSHHYSMPAPEQFPSITHHQVIRATRWFSAVPTSMKANLALQWLRSKYCWEARMGFEPTYNSFAIPWGRCSRSTGAAGCSRKQRTEQQRPATGCWTWARTWARCGRSRGCVSPTRCDGRPMLGVANGGATGQRTRGQAQRTRANQRRCRSRESREPPQLAGLLSSWLCRGLRGRSKRSESEQPWRYLVTRSTRTNSNDDHSGLCPTPNTSLATLATTWTECGVWRATPASRSSTLIVGSSSPRLTMQSTMFSSRFTRLRLTWMNSAIGCARFATH